MRGLEIVELSLLDDAGDRFAAKWIGRHRYVYGRFSEGMRLFVRGRVERNFSGPIVNVAQHAVLAEGAEYRGELVPVYRASKELASRKIAFVVKKNIQRLLDVAPDDPLPAPLAAARGYLAMRDAYRAAHAPETPQEAASARERFVFAEFLALATAAELRRSERERDHDARALDVPPDLLERFERALPFALTGAQRKVDSGDLGRYAPGRSDESSAPGRRRQRQDAGRRRRRASRRRKRLAVRADGADGVTGVAARREARSTAAAVRIGRRGALRQPELALARWGPREAGERRGFGRRGDARAARRARRFRSSGPGHHRRAAPLRRRAASPAARQGQVAAHPAHDRDPDPANVGSVGLCRPRPFHHRRAAAGAHADRDVRRARQSLGARLRVRSRESSPPDIKRILWRRRSRKGRER